MCSYVCRGFKHNHMIMDDNETLLYVVDFTVAVLTLVDSL